MSVCNFCTLEGVRAHAAAAGHEVILRADPKDGFPDGIAVYSAPPGTTEEESENWFACWLAKLPESCAC